MSTRRRQLKSTASPAPGSAAPVALPETMPRVVICSIEYVMPDGAVKTGTAFVGLPDLNSVTRTAEAEVRLRASYGASEVTIMNWWMGIDDRPADQKTPPLHGEVIPPQAVQH